MALKQEYATKVNDRVRIKDSVTHMYPSARAYMEGIVRHRTHDHLGYPLIYVQWDRDHWAYSGEEDRWALEAHFELVEDQMAEDKDQNELLKALAELVQSFQSDETRSEYKDTDPRPDRMYSYDETLDIATRDARDGEAFIILAAKFDDNILVPEVYMHSKRDDARMILDAAMADVTAQTYARTVINLIEQAKRKADGPSDGPSSS